MPVTHLPRARLVLVASPHTAPDRLKAALSGGDVASVILAADGVDTDTLQDAGFKVKVVHAATYFGLGFVVGQEPGGGSMHPKGTTIVLTIT